MSYKCIRTFESKAGITYRKHKVIPLSAYEKLNYLEQKNFEPCGETI